MNKSIQEQIQSLPTTPGVYLFKNSNEEIIYIGKAKQIRKRVQSHFSSQKQAINFYAQVASIETIPTRTERNALILENDLIKKHQPKYNIELKDDKNYTFVSFSPHDFPIVSTTHQPKKKGYKYNGPFISAREVRSYLKQLRKLFPYRTCTNAYENPCLYADLGLCAAHTPHTQEEYTRILLGLEAFLSLLGGKRVALEGYDISHSQGSYTVGSMVRFSSKTPKKDMYRRFKIQSTTNNDPKALKEIISRRLTHDEWSAPDLIVVDGGKGQLAHLKDIPLPVVALAKGAKRDMESGTLYSHYGSIPLLSLPPSISETLLRLRNEAHRFAITYQRLHHTKTLL